MSPEQTPSPNQKLPSGYESVRQLDEPGLIGPETLPWAREILRLPIAECRLQSGETFYLASAVSAHSDLQKAAEGMSEDQRQSTDNMFYSRLPEYIQRGFSVAIEKVPKPTTKETLLAAKNIAGQRVYFARFDLLLDTEDKDTNPQTLPVIVRLAACDKNRQKLVMKHLSGGGKADKGSK